MCLYFFPPNSAIPQPVRALRPALLVVNSYVTIVWVAGHLSFPPACAARLWYSLTNIRQLILPPHPRFSCTLNNARFEPNLCAVKQWIQRNSVTEHIGSVKEVAMVEAPYNLVEWAECPLDTFLNTKCSSECFTILFHICYIKKGRRKKLFQGDCFRKGKDNLAWQRDWIICILSVINWACWNLYWKINILTVIHLISGILFLVLQVVYVVDSFFLSFFKDFVKVLLLSNMM